MTMTQRRAAFGDPALVALREAALAEEAALIAGQAGDAGEAAPPGGPVPSADGRLTPPLAALC
jgi:hypothetical protein